jgi:hypothetical protein
MQGLVFAKYDSDVGSENQAESKGQSSIILKSGYRQFVCWRSSVCRDLQDDSTDLSLTSVDRRFSVCRDWHDASTHIAHFATAEVRRVQILS